MMVPDTPNPPKKKLEQGKDRAGHEFAGEVGFTERIGPPRPAPSSGPAKPAPRPPRPPGQPAAPIRGPDPTIAGSKYFTTGAPAKPEPHQMTSIHRQRSKDSEALDSTLDEDLGDITRRRDREKAAKGPEEAAVSPQGPSGSGTRKELDAEARPRELDFSAPDMPRRRRS